MSLYDVRMKSNMTTVNCIIVLTCKLELVGTLQLHFSEHENRTERKY